MSEKTSFDGYIILITAHARSSIRYSESYLRIALALEEADFQLLLKQYKPFLLVKKNTTLKRDRGRTQLKTFQRPFTLMRDHDGTQQIEYDDNSLKTKFFLTRYCAAFGVLRCDEKFFINSIEFNIKLEL